MGIRGQRTEDRRQRTEDRGQKTEDRGQRTEDRGQRTEDRGQRTEDRGQRTEDSSVARMQHADYGDCTLLISAPVFCSSTQTTGAITKICKNQGGWVVIVQYKLN